MAPSVSPVSGRLSYFNPTPWPPLPCWGEAFSNITLLCTGTIHVALLSLLKGIFRGPLPAGMTHGCSCEASAMFQAVGLATGSHTFLNRHPSPQRVMAVFTLPSLAPRVSPGALPSLPHSPHCPVLRHTHFLNLRVVSSSHAPQLIASCVDRFPRNTLLNMSPFNRLLK